MLGFAKHRAGDGKQLALPLAQVGRALRKARDVPLRQLANEMVRVRQARRLAALLVAGVQSSVADILHHRIREQEGILQHDAQPLAQLGLAGSRGYPGHRL